MDTKNDGLELEVRSPEISLSPGVRERVTLMVRAILERAGKQGRWTYLVTGTGVTLENPSQYWVLVDSPTVAASMLYVAVRACLVPKQTIAGMLLLAAGVNRSRLIQELRPLVDTFNRSGWEGVIEPEHRVMTIPGDGEKLPKTGRGIRTWIREEDVSVPLVRPAPIDGRTAIARERERLGYEGVANEVLPERKVKIHPPPASRSVLDAAPIRLCVPVNNARKEAEMPSSNYYDEAKLAQLLVATIKNTTDGSFSGRELAGLAKTVFPDRSGRGSVGALRRLEGLRWIGRVAAGQYQVGEVFLSDHRSELSGIMLVPRPWLRRAKPTGNGTTMEVTASKSNGLDLCELIRQRKELDRLIAKEGGRQKLEADLAAEQQILDTTQQNIERLRAALDALDHDEPSAVAASTG